MMKWFWDNYTISEKDSKNILASPLRATKADLAVLSPTLIHTAEPDVLRDEREVSGRKLDKAGLPLIVSRYNSMIQDFGLLNARRCVQESMRLQQS